MSVAVHHTSFVFLLVAAVLGAIARSRGRLRPSSCRWRGCDAVLNCADALTQHVALHPLEGSEEMVHHLLANLFDGAAHCSPSATFTCAHGVIPPVAQILAVPQNSRGIQAQHTPEYPYSVAILVRPLIA
jgi:hypothetical protein